MSAPTLQEKTFCFITRTLEAYDIEERILALQAKQLIIYEGPHMPSIEVIQETPEVIQLVRDIVELEMAFELSYIWECE